MAGVGFTPSPSAPTGGTGVAGTGFTPSLRLRTRVSRESTRHPSIRPRKVLQSTVPTGVRSRLGPSSGRDRTPVLWDLSQVPALDRTSRGRGDTTDVPVRPDHHTTEPLPRDTGSSMHERLPWTTPSQSRSPSTRVQRPVGRPSPPPVLVRRHRTSSLVSPPRHPSTAAPATEVSGSRNL